MAEPKPDKIINIVLVDDVAETREKVQKLLSFEPDFRVVGMAATGREGLAKARELRPDIIIMDINMPDMDGLEATTQVMNTVPGIGIIMLSAQDDPNYIRMAMMAGAKGFLTKPPTPDDLYNTIRSVYKRAPLPLPVFAKVTKVYQPGEKRDRGGNIIVVYSPQGGAGCTTIATNLASGLMRDGIQVLLVDANLQFGDVGVFLNLQAHASIVDLVDDVDDLDTEFFENSLTIHQSGLKVLMGPPRPELAEKVSAKPQALIEILTKVRSNYDFIVVDTSLNLDEMTLGLMDLATRIILVSTPTLASLKNVGFVLDLFQQLEYPQDKIVVLLNRVSDDRNMKKTTISASRIATYLKRPVNTTIPSEEAIILDAVHRGIPVVASQRDVSKSPIKELLGFAEQMYVTLMPEPEAIIPGQKAKKASVKLGA